MASIPGIHQALLTAIGINETSGEVPMELLIDLAKQGVPNDQVVRLFLWELLLNIRPADRSKWQTSVSSRHSLYWVWVDKYFADVQNWLELDLPSSGEMKVHSFGLANNQVMAQIHGDLVRTPSSTFASLGIGATDEEIRPHMRRIERLLYVFSCLNAAYNYTQGFNELAYPMYHVALLGARAQGLDDNFAEASAFFLLQNLITGTGLGDLFTMEQDFESVDAKFDMIRQMTKIVDAQLYKHIFVDLALNPLQFAFPWVSILFSDLYQLGPLLLLWDRFLLKEAYILEFAMALATAQLLDRRDALIKANYNGVMDILNNTRDFDAPVVIARAEDVFSQFISLL